MTEDRYKKIANDLRYLGWLQDLMLRRARMGVVDVFRARETQSVLDACCGAGTLSRYLNNAGIDVTGVDASKAMLALARGRVQDMTFIEGDLTELCLNETVDGAVVALALHEMREDARLAVWESMRKAVRPGGTLILLDYTTPPNNTIASELARRVIWKDEASIGKDDPDHFLNYQDFMSFGGAKSWLLNHGESIREDRYFLFGNLGLFAVTA